MTDLTLSLFGRFQATRGGQPIENFRTSKVQALLVYLVAEPRPHSRESLMDLLWPGMPQRSARHNLRQILYYLRGAIPELATRREGATESVPVVLTNRQTIQLNPDAAVSADIEQFRRLIDGAKRHRHVDLLLCPTCRQDLQEAAALYQGDFLADFYLEDSNEFENWAQIEREAFRRQVLDALEILAAMAIRREGYPAAISLAERQLDIDNLRESSYRQLMEALALSGRREEALAAYDACRRVLTEELSMAPAKRTTEIYDRILAGDLHFDQDRSQGVRGYEIKEEIGAGAHGVIYRAVQPAIGREVAVKVIGRRLANNPEFIRRFEDEMHVIASLEHPYVVPLYDYWRNPDGAYLIMRYLKGGSLLSALQDGPWALAEAAEMLDQVASALAAAHQMGIVHCDIKPANILLDPAGNAYLSDFGIARAHGQDPRPRVGDIVGTLDYVSPEQILNEETSAQSDIYSLGAVMYEVLTGEKPFGETAIANLIYRHLHDPIPRVGNSRNDLPAYVDAVLQKATAKRPGERYAGALEMASAFRQAALGGVLPDASAPAAIALTPIVRNPYKGLMAFQEADSDDFFGRESLIERLIDRLAGSPERIPGEYVSRASGRFLAIVGPSGGGKSSAVRAGLLPALRQGALPGSENWFIASMVPGAHPFEELATALWPIAVDPPPDLVGPMKRDERGLLRTLRRILPDEPGVQLLLFIDQFEELFTLVEDEEERAHFIRSLLAAISVPHSPLRIVMTLRADFYDRPLLYQSLGRLLKESTEIILPMTPEEISWAIREPARRAGASLEAGLAEAIVADVAHQPGALPLMQYALTELFANRQGSQMTLATYHAIGRVRGALSRRASEIYEALEPEGQEAARQVFLRLVTIGEGLEVTRRRVLRSELEMLNVPAEATDDEVSGDQPEAGARWQDFIGEVIDRYGQARLLTFDRDVVSRGPTVDIAHEALLREWSRLRSWLDDHRADVRQQQQLSLAAAAWQAAGQDESYVLRSVRLAQFEAWDSGARIALTGDEAGYLRASLAARDRELAEEEARQQRELLAAQQLAETEKARAEVESRRVTEQAAAMQQLRRRAVLLAGALALAVALAILAALFGQSARANAELAANREALAQSRELAAASGNQLDIDPELGILLAIQALAIEHTIEAEQALHMALLASRVRGRFAGYEEQLQRVAYSPDGSMVAAAAHEEESGSVWNMEDGQKLFDFPVAWNLWGVHFDNDGRRVAAAQPGATFRLGIWDTASSELLEEISLPDATSRTTFYALNAGWTQAALASEGGEVTIWDLGRAEQLFQLPGHSGWVEVEYSQNGSRLVTADSNGLVTTLDAQSGEILDRFETGDGLNDHAVSPTGDLVALARNLGGRSLVEIWPSTAGEHSPSMTFSGHSNALSMVVFSSDGRYVASAGREGTVRIWDLVNEEEALVLPHTPSPRSLAFHPNGRSLLTGDLEGAARVWDISPGGASEKLTVAAHDDTIGGIALSPDGAVVATAGWDGVGKLIDLAGGSELALLEGHEDWLTAVAFHPSGERVATGSTDSSARTWDAATGQPLMILTNHREGNVGGLWHGVLSVAYSPDGQRVATAGADGTARIWGSESGEELLVLGGRSGGLTTILYSPDGRYVVTGSDQPNAAVRFWDAATGEERFAIPEADMPRIWGMDISPDSRLLATSGHETVKLWALNEDMSGAELLARLDGHANVVVGLHFSRDGRLLASATTGETRLWDLAGLMDDGRAESISQRLVLPGGESIAFSPDDKELINGGNEGLLRVYVMDVNRLLDLAHARTTRWLSESECRQYLHVDVCPPPPDQ